MKILPRATRTGLLCLTLLACALNPTAASALLGDCGQPVSNGEGPGAADSLAILQEAVGSATACDAKPCICDVNDNGAISAIDALVTLKKAVGQDVDLVCDCIPQEAACTSVEATILPGSMLDLGWTGMGHDSSLALGYKVGLDIVSRCVTDGSICEQDSDCPSNGACLRTCDCVVDTTCELAGPVGPRRCRSTLAECATNADCPVGVPCDHTFSPPQPFSAAGAPICVMTFLDAPLHGTADYATGEITFERTALRWRQFLGLTLDQPSPRCGPIDQEPTIGEAFTCEGGQFPGKACSVDAVHPLFGGVSYECPPSLAANISGNGQILRLTALTTSATTKTARLPCSDLSFQSHPSRGNGKCLDDDTACSTNADCMRCSDDPATACTGNADCEGKGSCAEAPDQPVTCGYWCHCGFCDDDPTLPCFQDGDCPNDKACVAGSGTGPAPVQNVPQKKPNDCGLDRFLCGMTEEGTCAETMTGTCSYQPWRACSDLVPCLPGNSGICITGPRPCFESRITRSGEASAIFRHCEADGATCTVNADCTAMGGPCLEGTMAPVLEALGCLPASSSVTVNNASGITGPVSLRLKQILRWCRCGDSEIGCSERCDDGNRSDGDGCDSRCELEE
jgi:cysteine-rich repeat protein